MKKLNQILLIMVIVALSVMAYEAYAAYTIELTDLKVKGISIYMKDVKTGDPPVPGQELTADLYSILYNDDGNTKSIKKLLTLTAGQRAHFVDDLKPFIQAACVEYDVNVPGWAQP